jgi:hypothetical protein
MDVPGEAFSCSQRQREVTKVATNIEEAASISNEGVEKREGRGLIPLRELRVVQAPKMGVPGIKPEPPFSIG